MSERLAELRRQRALAQEHLDWLDREIARESAAIAPPPATPPASPPSPPAADPETILAQYQVAPDRLHQDVRKGCLLYFTAACVALGLLLAVLYLTLGRR